MPNLMPLYAPNLPHVVDRDAILSGVLDQGIDTVMVKRIEFTGSGVEVEAFLYVDDGTGGYARPLSGGDEEPTVTVFIPFADNPAPGTHTITDDPEQHNVGA